MTTRKTYVTVVIGAVVAVVPPLLVYLQASAELSARAARSDREAEVGYATLVDSVRELRSTVEMQSDTISRLQGHVEAIEGVMQASSMRLTAARPQPLPPVMRPNFDELPANLDAAQTKR
jgi:hypothetical protein